MKLNLDRYNERLTQDLKEVVTDIKAEGGSMGITHRRGSPSPRASLPKITGRTRKEDGAIAVIAIKLPRVLIYTHKGAGRGQGGPIGSTWYDKNGNRRETDPKSYGQMNTGSRKEKPFINKILDSDRGVEKIANTAAEEMGNAIVNNMFIK